MHQGTNGKNNNSIIQNHPPKRLQRLLEGVASPPPTLEELEDKLASAEVRRNQVNPRHMDLLPVWIYPTASF